jgi:ribulose-phosphate 3-epimerase
VPMGHRPFGLRRQGPWGLMRSRPPLSLCPFAAGNSMARRFGREENLARLRAASPAVLPSLLASDFGRLAEEIERVESAGVPALHLDIMDGHFVPNLSFGLPVVEAVRSLTSLPLDVHLMIERPEAWVERYRDAGADGMTIHIEVVPEPRPVLERIRELGAWAGLTLNPPTPLAAIVPSLPYCDLILVMSVMPGFGGQKFDEAALPKLRALRAARERGETDALLEVDGGIDVQTVGAAVEAGVDLLVAGTAVFGESDYGAAIRALQAGAAQGSAGPHAAAKAK